jgi:hypothetical protein
MERKAMIWVATIHQSLRGHFDDPRRTNTLLLRIPFFAAVAEYEYEADIHSIFLAGRLIT